MEGRFVAYYRVSTQRQGRSGLGLDAQRKAVRDYLNGGKWKLVDEVTEVESGKDNARPKLQEAIARCKLTGARLIIAKLDRLSRNAAFLLTLRDSGVQFVAADMPDANNMVIGVMALVAQHEREAISARTKAALAAAKARGVKLGNPKGHRNLVPGAGTKRRAELAHAWALDRWPTIKALLDEGMSLNAIARTLNERRILTASGTGQWTPAAVSRVVQRFA